MQTNVDNVNSVKKILTGKELTTEVNLS